MFLINVFGKRIFLITYFLNIEDNGSDLVGWCWTIQKVTDISKTLTLLISCSKNLQASPWSQPLKKYSQQWRHWPSRSSTSGLPFPAAKADAASIAPPVFSPFHRRNFEEHFYPSRTPMPLFMHASLFMRNINAYKVCHCLNRILQLLFKYLATNIFWTVGTHFA